MSQPPRFPLCDLVNVRLMVPDLEQAATFYTTIWGLVEAARAEGVVYLRGSGGDPYILALHGGDRSAVISVGFRADPATDLALLRERVREAGGRVEPIAPVADYGGGVAFTFRDRGNRLFSIVQGDACLSPIDAPLTPRRLAHVNINTADVEAEIGFYQQGLGFVLTDRTNIMSFLRTNDDHHVVVLATDVVDTLNHIAFLQDDLESVMKASGRMVDAGYPVAWGPGRHGPGDNVFNYFIDPFGFVIEHTAEILKVDDSYKVGGPADWVWPPGRTDQWGVGHVKDDACKKAQRAISFS
ncbi:MAG: glyoxalase [Pelagibacterium sp. SCN 64-44]|nr:MAG: glyoxalase [Pelagibacterium sp. SCN 64-44]